MINPFESGSTEIAINKDTAITLVIDRSGSMNSIWESTVEGFKEFLNGQKEVEGEVLVRLVVFDTEVIEALPFRKISTVFEDILSEYPPRSLTSLYDAVKIGIEGHNTLLESFDLIGQEVPANNILLIFTDGGENSSKDTSKAEVMEMLEQWESAPNKELIFLGAGSDAWGTGLNGLGVSSTSSIYYEQSDASTSSAWNVMNVSVSNYRSSRNDLVNSPDATAFESTRINLDANLINEAGEIEEADNTE